MNNNAHIPLEPIHESSQLLGGRILFLQLIIGTAAVIVNAELVNLLNSMASVTSLIISLAIITILLQTIDAVMLVILVLRWAHHRYLITKDEIIVDQGTWHIQRAVYKIKDISSLEIRQSFAGKIFNYGTVIISASNLKSEISLINIPNPQAYGAYIEELAGQKKNG
jgi:membrane protein YdbS with pleckstrin-like domain